MLEQLKGLFKKTEKFELPLIHPDFNKIDAPWRWNYIDWVGFCREKDKIENEKHQYNMIPGFKIAFGFDDPSILDGCPFMGKVMENEDKNTKYWGVFYGEKKDFQEIKNWAAQRTNSIKVLDYESEGHVDIDLKSDAENERIKWLSDRIIIRPKAGK